MTTIPQGATRTFYAGQDAAASVHANVLGDGQVLYYDVYPPVGQPTGLTSLYIHGGALDIGYANSARSESTCRQLTELGTWCISIEYRRGFAGFIAAPESSIDVTPSQAARYRTAFNDARNDVAEAWFHADGMAETVGFPRRYVIVGEDSGARIASDLGLATSGLPYDIAGVVVASGTHDASRSLLGAVPFPVVLQSGLFDTVSPAFTGRLYLDNDMPQTVGARSLYDLLAANGSTVRLYLTAQEGHGFGSYRSGNGRIGFLADAFRLFTAESAPDVPAAIEYRFICSDANFGAAGPRVTVSTAQLPGFRYEPYESDMESGLSPEASLELHPLELGNCEG